jgi:sugar phosphate isomerase/epimerase
VTLDIGHFTAANFDAVKFLEEHHPRIHALHVKDRKKQQGAGMPLGEGDAPVKEVLRLLRDRGWDIPAHIEFDYRPADPVAEAANGYTYCRSVLETK